MKISIKQFADNDHWTNYFQLHFIINNLDTNEATYHVGIKTNNVDDGLLYDDDEGDLTEPFKFTGEIE